MPAPIKKLLTSKMADIVWEGSHYDVPINVLKQYKTTENVTNDFESIESVFEDLIEQYGEPAVILKGLRTRECLSQIEFSEAISVTQQNLSAMEHGRRSIGKKLAKRIAHRFNINYRLLL